jgi:hypothetical protein
VCRLQKIDEMVMPRHKYLVRTDSCYYLMDYPPYNKYGRTPNTCKIMDFKIKADRKGTPEWERKKNIITEIAKTFIKAYPFKDKDTVLVPMPPSKKKDDPDYDDRIVSFLNQFCAETPKAYLKEIISVKESMEASHLSDDRKSPDELLEYLVLDTTFSLDGKDVIIVDDVIRHGAHYKACEKLILSKFKPTLITGMFIGSTTL